METATFNYFDERTDDGTHIALSKSDFDAFSDSLLWLAESSPDTLNADKFDALAAIFDLQGFTSFFDVRDPFATVPDFVDKFLFWLFETLKVQFSKKRMDDKVLLWSYLPMFAKFMGDGVLLLWNIPKDQRHGGALAIGNIVARLHQTCLSYKKEFIPEISKNFTNPPATLRCGGAFGQVAAVGNRYDYVGPCINVAARLQKVGTLSFAFSRHGCTPEQCFLGEWQDVFAPTTIRIRGMHREEPILVDVREFEAIPLKIKEELFLDSATPEPATSR